LWNYRQQMMEQHGDFGTGALLMNSMESTSG
jgi:hypothetical protein